MDNVWDRTCLKVDRITSLVSQKEFDVVSDHVFLPVKEGLRNVEPLIEHPVLSDYIRIMTYHGHR